MLNRHVRYEIPALRNRAHERTRKSIHHITFLFPYDYHNYCISPKRRKRRVLCIAPCSFNHHFAALQRIGSLRLVFSKDVYHRRRQFPSSIRVSNHPRLVRFCFDSWPPTKCSRRALRSPSAHCQCLNRILKLSMAIRSNRYPQ